MKKYVMFTMLIAMMVCLLAVPGHIEAAPEVSVKVDGQYVSFPDQKPYIDSANRTMVPVRAPMEAMGCTVEWNDKTRQATITKGDKTAVFTIGKNTYTVNGQTKTMDTKAVIVGNRTAFPIRFAAEAMGAKVDWDANTYTVLITTGGATAEVKTVDLGRSNDPFKEDNIQVGNYIINVTNNGVNDPGIWFGIGDNSYPPKDIRVVCISHPEWNTCTKMGWDGKYYTIKRDTWTNSYIFSKEGYTPSPKSGDKVTFDIYGKINGQEAKLVTITKVLP